MNKQIARGLMYGGAFTALASAFSDLQSAQTWAEVMTPAHVFGFLGALTMAAGALFHPTPQV